MALGSGERYEYYDELIGVDERLASWRARIFA